MQTPFQARAALPGSARSGPPRSLGFGSKGSLEWGLGFRVQGVIRIYRV